MIKGQTIGDTSILFIWKKLIAFGKSIELVVGGIIVSNHLINKCNAKERLVFKRYEVK